MEELQNQHVEEKETEVVNDDLDGEYELRELLKALNSEEETETESEGETEETESETETESEEETDETDETDETEEETPKKKVQSKEENAKYAAMRRQREMEERIQAELERLKQESPEFQLAKQLSELYGTTPEQLMEQLREAQLHKEAEEKGVPIEILKERQKDIERMNQLEQELNRLRFEQWQARIEADGMKLKQEYSMLTDEDIQEAVDYMLNTVQNVNIPLEQAVFAVHGKKIAEHLAQAKLQEQLANDGGRKKTPVTPKSKGTSQTKTLSAEEQYIAKQLGLSVDEYLQYKEMK